MVDKCSATELTIALKLIKLKLFGGNEVRPERQDTKHVIVELLPQARGRTFPSPGMRTQEEKYCVMGRECCVPFVKFL